MQFIYKMVTTCNTRLWENDDIVTLEACTIFDPRPQLKTYNRPLMKQHLNVLVKVFGTGVADNDIQIRNGAAQWFSTNFDGTGLSDDFQAHFTALSKRKKAGLADFGLFALNVAKNLLATAVVENFFSTISQVQSSYRFNLDADKVESAIVMRTEKRLEDLAWDLFWDEFGPEVSSKKLTGIRGSYTKRKKPPKNPQKERL